MLESTRQRLLALNRRFYDDGAGRFSATRQRPWQGWRELLPELGQAVPGGRVLDAGCGNGRLAAFLAAEGLLPEAYLGLDGSEALLADARASVPHPPFAFLQLGLEEIEGGGEPHPPAPLSADGKGGEPNFGGGTPLLLPGSARAAVPATFGDPHPPAPLSVSERGERSKDSQMPAPRREPEGRSPSDFRFSPLSRSAGRGGQGGEGPLFDVIALFGVLHHVPGRAARQELMESLAARLAPGGILLVSFWLLDRFPERFAKLRLGDGDFLGELEEGDALLSFDGKPERPRYCHFPDEEEIDALCRLPGCLEVRRFRADGPSGGDNLYAVLRQDPAAVSRGVISSAAPHRS